LNFLRELIFVWSWSYWIFWHHGECEWLLNLLQESFDIFALSTICSYTKELLRRLIQTTAATTPSLSRLVASLFTHHTSSPDCQAIVIHCISCVTSVFPDSVKDHLSALVEWTKKGLYSGHIELVKVITIVCTYMYLYMYCNSTLILHIAYWTFKIIYRVIVKT